MIWNEREPRDGATVLHWACCGVHPTRGFTTTTAGGAYDVCRYLLERSGGCEERRHEIANAVTWNSGTTPLHWTVWSSSGSNSNTNSRTHEQQEQQQQQQQQQQIAILELLLVQGGANPHAMDRNGNTAAHGAAASGSLQALQYLLTHWNLNALQCNAQGQTPLDCARAWQQHEVVAWLEEYVATISTTSSSSSSNSTHVAAVQHSNHQVPVSSATAIIGNPPLATTTASVDRTDKSAQTAGGR